MNVAQVDARGPLRRASAPARRTRGRRTAAVRRRRRRRARCRAAPRAPRRTSIVCGKHVSATKNCARAAAASIRFACTRCSIVIASAAAVASSSSDALATSIPVRSLTIVWKLRSASRRPCAISAWYGVYGVYQPGFSSTLRRMTLGVIVVVVAEADDTSGTGGSSRADLAAARGGTRARSCRAGARAASSSRMRAGMASSMSASSEGAPTTFSISRRSAASGPMWRDWKCS